MDDGALAPSGLTRLVAYVSALFGTRSARLGVLSTPRSLRQSTTATPAQRPSPAPAGFTQITARRLMVPRYEIAAIRHDVPLPELISTVATRPYTRYPVYEHSLDNMIGVISAKQILTALASLGDDVPGCTVTQFMSRPTLFVPASRRADLILTDMKAHRTHLAIVVDEYGQTAGLVTFRDVVAHLVEGFSDVPDELEEEKPSPIEWMPDGSALIDGTARRSTLEAELGMRLPATAFDTIGGMVFGALGRRPLVGDEVRIEGRLFSVHAVDGLRITRVRMIPPEQPAIAQREPPLQTS
jgi:CBS domain containing-hemolysin-like protein